VAARGNRVTQLPLLLEYLDNEPGLLDTRDDEYGDTPLHIAARRGCASTVRALLEAKALTHPSVDDECELSVLAQVAIRGGVNGAIAALLIEHKANLADEMVQARACYKDIGSSARECAAAAELFGWANKAGEAFTAQARCARAQHVASHWTDSPLFDWHLVREITQYIEYNH
jgi:hypothetical protein